MSGSLRSTGAEDDRQAVGSAARELGKALAPAGHSVLVVDDDPEEVDSYVMAGYLSLDHAGGVEVRSMRGATPPPANAITGVRFLLPPASVRSAGAYPG